MIRYILFFLFFYTFSFGTVYQTLEWEKGESFLSFLQKHKISKDLYFNLSKTDQELCSEIEAGVEYSLLEDKNGHLAHTLIPINEEMQIHIHRTLGAYVLDIIPVVYETKTETLSLKIANSPYQDIVHLTKNKLLANEFVKAFQKSVNFKKVHKDDIVAIQYQQKIRMGRYYGAPTILGAYVQLKNQENKYVFHNEDDGFYYDEKGNSLISVMFKIPLLYKRISSEFTLKRFHPVLKIYRAHLGVDFAAPVGTKVWATSSGKISFMGTKGGYGNTVIVSHDNNLKSLYAHLSKFNKKYRTGSVVKQGDVIGYVGSSGLSSGPHLHFGMYKNSQAMNPLKVMSTSKKTLSGKVRNNFMANIAKIKKELQGSILEDKKVFFKLEPIETYSKYQMKQ